ncbi:MAG TPA: ABC transporter ATP-binding protein [Vicinamibacteria bacterium]|nr:ABC transporter ATP-binding protein [Vicinamibacteria bacterium]
MSVIELRRVSRWYGSALGLRRVDLDFDPGVTALLGPNGAGKSTLIRIVAGLLRPSSGEVSVAGEPPFANSRVFARLGVVLEEGELRPQARISVFDWLVFLLRLNGFAEARARELAASRLSELGLLEARDRSVTTLSRGMKQRLRLAQAAAHDPELLLLDEPLSGLDPLGRHEVIEWLRAQGQRGKTIVVSSHILHEVELMTQNVVLMAEGTVLASGNLREIRALIDSHPHRIAIRTPSPRALARRLLEAPAVLSIEFSEELGRLELETNDPESFYSFVSTLVLEENAVVDEIQSADDDLESVFRYLVGP